MANIKLDFSKEAFNAETPSSIKLIYRIIMAISGIWLMVVSPNLSEYISEHLRLLIANIIGSANGGIYFICQFFHWQKQTTDGTDNS